MAIDIIALVGRQLTPEVAARLSALTGESPTATEKALSSAVPTTLAGMLKSASSPGGVDRLVGLFDKAPDDSITCNFAGLLDGEGLNELLRSGSSIIGSLFGPRQDAVTNVIAKSSGVRQSSAATLLGAAAPLVLGIIKRQLSSRGGVTGSSLLDLLKSQRNAIVSSAPPEVASALGTRDLSSLGASIDRPAAPLREPVPQPRRSRNWLPLLAGLAALLLLIPLFRGFVRRPAEQVGRAAVVVDTPETEARPTTPGTAKVALPGGRSIDVGENTVVYNLQRFLADKSDTRLPRRFTFDNLNFATNSTSLTPESRQRWTTWLPCFRRILGRSSSSRGTRTTPATRRPTGSSRRTAPVRWPRCWPRAASIPGACRRRDTAPTGRLPRTIPRKVVRRTGERSWWS
jgi:OOP family OmpA-OmpF porin